jgi:TolA-binding protein
MFDRYLQYCPNDPKAGQVLFYLAVKSEKAGDQDAADAYLAKIITDYQQDQNYPRALSKRAWKAYQDKDYAGAIKGMALYIKESQPSPNKAQAMFALADCLRQTSNIVAAAKYFQVLVNEISPANNPYGRSREEIDTNTKLLEQARFYLAYSLSRVGNDDSRKQAVAKLKEFLELYPQSGLAAKALNLQGSLQMALKDPAANETFARLARDYPNTDEGKNAQYARISGALELDQIEQAHEAFAAMLADAAHYSIEEFVRVGQAMLDKEQWKQASEAFGRVVGKTEERMYLERALYGIGAAKYALKDYEGAVASLNDLMTRWPNSGLFYQAKFMLARANIASGDLSAAKIALNDVFRYATEPELLNDASLVYADVLMQGDEKTQALATYKRMEYFSSQNMKTEKARAQISTAILAGMALAEELGRTADVIDSCDKYLQLYPTGPQVSAVRDKRQTAAMRLATEATAGGEGTQTP